MSKAQIILVAIVSLISFFWLFLLIGLKVYDFFMTEKARKMIKNGWRCCSLCSNAKCLFRGNETGDGCYGEYECLRYMEYSDLNKDSEVNHDNNQRHNT